MKPLKVDELREMSDKELHALCKERRRVVFDLRFKHYTGQLEDTASLKINRRDIARIETVLSERANAATEE